MTSKCRQRTQEIRPNLTPGTISVVPAMDCMRDSNNPYEYNLYQGPTQCDPVLDTYRRDPTLEDIRQELAMKCSIRQ